MEPEMMDTTGDQSVEFTERKRIGKACDVCYRKKIKCDGAAPRCNWCAHHDTDCSYERRTVRKKRFGKEHRSQLLDRVDRLERLLAKAIEQKTVEFLPRAPSSGPSDSATDTSLTREDDCNDESRDVSTPLAALGSLHFADWRLGSVNLSNSIPVFSEHGEQWIRSRTGGDASLERITALRQSWHSIVHSNWGVAVNLRGIDLPTGMPDRQVVEKCLALYHHSFVCRVFPVVDPVRFQTTIATAYSSTSSHPSYDIYNAQACILAFLAFASFFNLCESVKTSSSAERYALMAHRILTACGLAVTVEMLQTSTMLVRINATSSPPYHAFAELLEMMYHLFSGDLPHALFQNSVSVRIIYMLGAHTTTYPSCTDVSIVSANPSYRERYLLRNIFWLTYILDKELALRSGQPPCLQDEQCDLSLPQPFVQPLYSRMMGLGSETSFEDTQLFPGHPWLSTIKSKAYGALYSARAVGKTDAEILRDIRELDDDLEYWRLSIPPSHRPTVSFTRAALPENGSTMASVMIHLDYNHCVAVIHQATSRCQNWSFGNHDEMEGVGTSLALSIEASRSSLTYLQMASHLLDDNSFWMILYYPMSALLALFYGILHRPLAPQSRQDLELLKNIPPMIRRIPMSRRMENVAHQIRAVDDLVEELTTLGQCAIDKATRESRGETRHDFLPGN